MPSLLPTGKQQFTNNVGVPLAGGKIYTFDAGTTTPKATYQDAAGAVENPNPIILNARGEALVFWDGAYDVKVTDANGIVIYTVTNYSNRTDVSSIIYAGAQLGDILKTSLHKVVGSVSALRAVDKSKNTQVMVTGYYAPGDGGGGIYYFDAADSASADNGGTVIVAADGGRWKIAATSEISVKQFGAKGGGVTDDAAALQKAANALPNGGALYFPAGTYIVDTACVTFLNKQRIRVFGDGKATVVRPSVQGVAPVKQDYPSTIQFDLCSYLTVHDMVIESKGESYGNIDAYGALAGGDPRAQAIGKFGGSALVVSRSDNVLIENIDARRCGSCGVVYLSSCEDVVVINCFANARSVGYAGFAIDNWAHSDLKPKRTYKLVACRVAKEDADVSAKAGIAAEGDQETGRLINLEVAGGTFEDCATGSNVLYLGAGISCFETRLTMSGVSVKNCYIGVSWQKRGGAVDKSWCRVSGGYFDACAVTGAHVAIGTANGGADVSFIGVRMDIQPTSYWAAQASQVFNVSSGVTVAGYTSGEINVVGCRINGGQYGLWAVDNVAFNVSGADIAGSLAAIRTYGGGNLKVSGSRLRVTSGDRVIGRDTGNLAATASYNMFTYVSSNTLECFGNTTSDYGLILSGNPALFNETQVARNSMPKGVISAPMGSATLYDVDVPFVWAPVIQGDAVGGTYEINAALTRATATRVGNLVHINAYIVLAAAITGGGTGNLMVSGIPFPKRANSAAYGIGAFSGIDYGNGTQISCYFGTTGAASSLLFWQTADNASVTLLPISGAHAGNVIAFSITYEI